MGLRRRTTLRIFWWRFRRQADVGSYLIDVDSLVRSAVSTPTLRVGRDNLVIGRLCEDGLPPGGTREISRTHAELFRSEDGQIWIRDRTSRNGTFVSGVRLQPGASAPLRRGSVIEIGKEWLGVVVDCGDEEASTPAIPAPLWQLDNGSAIGPTHLELLAGVKHRALRWTRGMRPESGLCSILVEGEDGTGKRHLARMVADWSERDFHLVHCPSLTPALGEALLFGTRGRLVGTDRAIQGAFREADGAVLFLDEVGSLACELQEKLLSVIRTGDVQPLGQARPLPVDVLLIAATTRPLADQPQLRQDLSHQLSTIRLRLRPLRERREEIPFLLGCFLRDLSPRRDPPPVARGVVRRLCLARWPDNVRGLRAMAEKLLAAADGAPAIGVHHLRNVRRTF